MAGTGEMETLAAEYIQKGDHGGSDYFGLIKELVKRRNRFERAEREYAIWQEEIDRIYELVRDEILTNQARPRTPVKFGTSGWRGIIGKDLCLKSVRQVTQAIIAVYQEVVSDAELAKALGVETFSEAQIRGCVIGFDNRFGGELLAQGVVDVL
ncbi:MAG: phosphoglucomutase, partial [Desulfobulbales bacterium]